MRAFCRMMGEGKVSRCCQPRRQPQRNGRLRRLCAAFALVVVIEAAIGLLPPSPGRAAEPAQSSPDKQTVDEATADAARLALPLVCLLRDPVVRNELNITAEQATRIDTALSEVDYPLWGARDAQDPQLLQACANACDHLEEHVAKIMTPAQRQRLDGIWLQAQGWPVVLLPRFATDLKLSDDQKKLIRSELAAAAKQGGNAANDANQKVKESLTADQQRLLQERIGTPFRTSDIRQRPCRAPELTAVDEWINSEPLELGKLKGKVVAVHFWAFGCINCVRNLPHYQSWQQKYADQGLVIIGLHTPETKAERVVDAVRAKVAANGMQYPVAIDGQAANWKAWSNRWWPSVYLIDKQGYVRYWWYGELNWQGNAGEEHMRGKIEALLSETD